MKNNVIKSSLMILVASVVLSACNSAISSEKKASVVPPLTIETISLERKQLSTALQMPGELIAYQQVDLYAKISSYVKDLKVDIGSEVTQGQLLVRLEAPELSSQMAGAQSRLKSQEALYSASNATYQRLLETSKTPGTISQNDLDIAGARKNSDFAQLEAARASLREVGIMRDYLEIRAPFSGVITARNANTGAYVGPAGKGSELPVFTLQEQKHLRLAVSIPDAYSGFLKQGDTVAYDIKSLPGTVFKTRISRMSGALDLRLRSQRVEMDIDNIDKRLLPGMIAEINIPLKGQGSTFVVPKTAVVRADEGLFIIAVVDGKAVRVPVKTGREQDTQIEVFGNLQEGATVIKKANEEIRNGAIVAGK